MATVTVDAGELTVEMQGADKLWALRSRLTIPLDHVRGATHDPGIVREPQGWKLGGSRIPGVIVAGTFRHEGEKVFWDVRDPERAVVIELRDETYQRLVVEVDDPRATVELVEGALTRP